ncbi:hypothetical protein Tco_0990155 [Tanacetum coccineum]|uniref:Uncharacterized protein n=1 Tax=Tanacetum coccineum TaxID=301880 RepID=A0ABQ5EVM8_9ASTR
MVHDDDDGMVVVVLGGSGGDGDDNDGGGGLSWDSSRRGGASWRRSEVAEIVVAALRDEVSDSFAAMNSKAQEISGKKDKSSSKKTEIAQDSKVEEDNEAELKMHMVIVKDDDIAVDAIPLATKPLVIVEYKIIKEGIIGHYQLFCNLLLIEIKPRVTAAQIKGRVPLHLSSSAGDSNGTYHYDKKDPYVEKFVVEE